MAYKHLFWARHCARPLMTRFNLMKKLFHSHIIIHLSHSVLIPELDCKLCEGMYFP